jgi:hypothetical protein
MKHIFIILVLLIISIQLRCDESKTDKILERSEETGKKVDTLYEQYKNDPLADKTWGVEFNPVRLIAQKGDSSTLSGAFSYFGKPMMEIVMPWYYYKNDFPLIEEGSGSGTIHHNGYDRLFYADTRVRLFTGNTSNGFFLSALARYANVHNTHYLKGSHYWDYYWDDEYQAGMGKRTEHKLGIGFGIGWRSFSQRGFYWAFSFSVGRYFIGDENILHNGATSLLFLEEASNDHDIFYDLEFLKFGFAF